MHEILTEQTHVKFPLPFFFSASAKSRNTVMHDTQVWSSRQSLDKGNKTLSSPAVLPLKDSEILCLAHSSTGMLDTHCPTQLMKHPELPQDCQLVDTSLSSHAISDIKQSSPMAQRTGEESYASDSQMSRVPVTMLPTPNTCQEVIGEASKMSDMLFRQKESTQSFTRVTQKGCKVQQGQQPETGKNKQRSHSKEVLSSLEMLLFANSYGKTAQRTIIPLHPVSLSRN